MCMQGFKKEEEKRILSRSILQCGEFAAMGVEVIATASKSDLLVIPCQVQKRNANA